MIAAAEPRPVLSRILEASRPASDVDLTRIERAVREILLAIGEDPDRDGLLIHQSRRHVPAAE